MKLSRTLRPLAAALAVIGLVAACSSGASPAASGGASGGAAGAKTYKDLTIGFIQTGSESGWRAANTASFKETATQLGINLKFYDAQNKLENQVSSFHQFNQDSSVNVIILAALDVTGYDEVLKEAKAAKKVVVLEDRRIDADPSLYYTYIGSDFALEGQKAAKAMCDLLKSSSGKKVVEISGAVGASAAIDRAKGFREKMGDCGITVTDTQTGNWGVPESKAVMEAFLKKSKDIQVIGVDATADGFKYLISGELGADIECNPLLAPQVYEAALKAVNGDTSLPKWVPSQEGEFFAAQGAGALQGILATRKY